ncbi:colanic acid biosynthesis glycosyltransferase WcaL [Candidatus Dependentiae bacterium]|nr:MAG: colanic acid biosynthesis glycosyltransferase WcaL [Candidatus Dependentiae bacterium]
MILKNIYSFVFVFMYVVNICGINILFVTGSFPHVSQRFIQDQIVKLINNGHSAHIQSLRLPKTDHLPIDFTKYKLIKKTFYGKELPPLELFDIVYVQFGYHGQQVVEQAKKQGFKGPIVVCFRGNDLSGYLQKNPQRYEQLFKDADLFLPVCNFFGQRLVQLGCDCAKIITHHSAININFFAFKKRTINSAQKLNLISVCRLVEKKGLIFAIKAVSILKKKYPHIKYTIVGDADTVSKAYKEYLQQLVKELGLEQQVLFYGWATHEELMPLLDKADIFLLPSITAADGDEEGIPNAAKEAMAVGLPVIITDHAGNSELVEHEKTGLLVKQKDELEIVKAVYWYIQHPQQLKQITQKAREKIEQEFAIDTTVKKLEAIFEQLLINKKAHK